jgi:hypothetical protein
MKGMRSFVPALAAAVVLFGSVGVFAQRGGGQRGGPPVPNTSVYRVNGTRDGASIFPKANYPQVRPLVPGQADFRHYHTPEESYVLMKAWAEKHPDLVELYSVGKSFEGRDIWQLTLTNHTTGKDTDKPAFFIEGGRHSGESTGSEATLYLIDYVLTNYGKDPAITKLLDTTALYCKPHNNPDGNMLYLTTAQTLRSTVRPNDDDGDGLLDEDPGDDLDGDGFVMQMRKYVGEGKGNAKKDPRDPSGRLMQRVQQGEGDYVLYPEGIDNDGDGRTNEDGIGGLDLHRNYPENWRPMQEATGRGYTQGGAGEYPLSEPETRAVFLFVMTHPNIGAVQTLDTSVPMILRGPSTERDDVAMTADDLALMKKLDAKAVEITSYPWAGDVYHVYANRGGGRGGQGPRDSPIFGHSPDFGYSYFGVPWYGDEIWNGGRFVDYDKDGRVDELEVLRWNDENRAGKGDFKQWTRFNHPTLGEVEIGGWNPKFYSQNPPPDLLETWARNEALWNLWLAEQLPHVKIVSAVATPARGPAAKGQKTGAVVEGEYDVTVKVTNEGQMPTALDIAKRVKIVRPDSCSLSLPSGVELVGESNAPQGAGARMMQRRAVQEIDWLKAGETRSVTWRVKGTGRATVTLASTRGGVDHAEVAIGVGSEN